MVLLDQEKDTASIVEVSIAFENEPEAFARSKQHKLAKYSPIVRGVSERGYSAVLDAILVGALGAWDPANSPALGIPDWYVRNLPWC